MSNQRTEQFLDLWRRLENAAERIVGHDARGGNAVIRMCRDSRYSAYREELDYCREVRNLLSHQPRINGDFAVQPSEGVVELLRTVLKKIEEPTRISDVMTPVDKTLCADWDTPVLKLMRDMRTLCFSHVPLLEKGRAVGVFSVETVFQAVMDGMGSFTPETTLRGLSHYLPDSAHMNYGHQFVDKDITLSAAENLFEKANRRNRKLKLLLVTRDGLPDSPLLGLVTPYDLMGRDD